jgi:hypothetical protein
MKLFCFHQEIISKNSIVIIRSIQHFYLGIGSREKSKNVIYKLTSINIETEKASLFLFLPQLKNFDHVQLINSDAIETFFCPDYFIKDIQKNQKSKLINLW